MTGAGGARSEDVRKGQQQQPRARKIKEGGQEGKPLREIFTVADFFPGSGSSYG